MIQVMRGAACADTYLAAGLLLRGNAAISDVTRNMARLRPNLRMAYWNPEVRARSRRSHVWLAQA